MERTINVYCNAVCVVVLLFMKLTTAKQHHFSINQTAILQNTVKNILGFKEIPVGKPKVEKNRYSLNDEVKAPKYMLDLYERYKYSTFPKGEQRGNTVRMIYADIGTVNRHRIFLFNLSSVLPTEKVFSAEIHLYKKQMKTRRKGSDISLIMFDVSKVNLNTLGDVFISSKTYGWQVYDVRRALQSCLRVTPRRKEHLFGLMFRSGGGIGNVDIPLKKFIRHHSKPFLIIYSNDTQNLTIDHIDPHFKPKDLVELNKQLAKNGGEEVDDVNKSWTLDNETIQPESKRNGHKKRKHFFFDENILSPLLNKKIVSPDVADISVTNPQKDDKELAMVGHDKTAVIPSKTKYDNDLEGSVDKDNSISDDKKESNDHHSQGTRKLDRRDEKVVSIIVGKDPGKKLIMIGPADKPIQFKKTAFDYGDAYMVREPVQSDEPSTAQVRDRRSVIDNEIPEHSISFGPKHRFSVPISHPGMLQGRRRGRRPNRKRPKPPDPQLIPYPVAYENERRQNKKRNGKNNRKHIRRRNKSHYNKNKTLPKYWFSGRRVKDVIPEKEQLCAKRKLQVNFVDIGWGEWIISPKSFEAHYCSGSCPFPLTKGMRPTNHATIQSIVHAIGMQSKVPAPCCVPDTMSSVTLLYFDENHNVVLKNYPGMSVHSCACR